MSGDARRRSGFTLVEVVLAIGIGSGLVLAVLAFYHHAVRVRDEVRRANGATASARLLIDTVAAELEGVLVDWGRHRRFKGWRDSIEYLTTSLPDRGAWAGEPDASTPYPQTDVRFVRYWRDGDRSKGRVKRAERRLLAAIERDGHRAVTESIAATGLPILRFRYFDGGRWHDEWQHHHLPHGVEITVGEKEHEIFRRIVAIPSAGDLGVIQ